MALDTAYRVQVRAGFQCAPLLHRALGTAPRGGTVRFSLGAGLAYVQQRGIEALRCHEQSLTKQLLTGLGELPGVTVYGPSEPEHRVGVVGITVDGWEPQDLATALDTVCRIQVRAGFQCAPLLHRALGTAPRGGTLRFSLGAFNTEQHIDAALDAVAELAAAPI
jgi:selenocysteine lyase/cysteine desulfurase